MAEPITVKLTGWYDGKQKPARPGVYQRRSPVTESHFILYSRWDGKKWGLGKLRPELATSRRASGWQSLPWRGLTEEVTL